MFYKSLFCAAFLWLSATCSLFAQRNSYLSVVNPQQMWRYAPGTIENATFSIAPQGAYFEVSMYLDFSVRGGENNFQPADQLEVRYDFSLPQEAIITDSWLWVGDQVVTAALMDRWKATQIYEGVVRRRQDPSLLTIGSTFSGETSYTLSIYPMLPTETRRVKITYLMPAQWAAKTVSLPFNTRLLQPISSPNPLKKATINLFADDTWQNPAINELPELEFSDLKTPLLGNFKSVEVPLNSNLPTTTLVLDSPMKNGIYTNQYWNTKDKDGWYQLIVLPSELISPKPVKKATFLLDWDTNSTFISSTVMLSALQQEMRNQLAPSDSFNVMYFNELNFKEISTKWIAATPENIQKTFVTLTQQPLSEYSNLPILLSNGLKFVRANRGGELILVSSSQGMGSISAANQLITDLKLTQTPVVPIHVAYFANRNLLYFRQTNGNLYFGNQLLYENLTRQTGGNYQSAYNLTADYWNVTTTLNKTLSKLSGTIDVIDIYPRFQGGFSYARLNSATEQISLNTPVIQVGRLTAPIGFKVEISGLLNRKAFIAETDVPHFTSLNPATAQIWAGYQMRKMLVNVNGTLTNAQILNIQNLSFQYRMLSPYTAFLALEPSMGGKVCESCAFGSPNLLGFEGGIGGVLDGTGNNTGGSGGGGVTPNNETESPAGSDKMEAYPNPMQEQTTLKIAFAKTVNAQNLKIEIYNLMGQVVKRLPISDVGSTKSLTIQWNGTNEQGEKVANGVYFVTITLPDGKRLTLKLVVQR